ncbi:DNA repair enzyme, putative [Eimeria brunetti]|uniref:DNA repair enzyme, putative n=1 Tax=Eimeria brunetti TaxID=51314 RepID=U6LPL5_9EIME|nr:DNA repair enzyme, putative [Eimeria brunetti]
MLDSLYGDLPPPTKGDGSEKGVSTPAPSGSLLGSLYDDPDDPAEASTTTTGASSSSGSAAVAAAAAAAATAANADTSSSSSAMWASQRLKLLTPAVVRRQTMAKAAPKASPSLNVQAAAADAALVLERLKKLHAGVLAEEQRPEAGAAARASVAAAAAAGKGGDAAAGTAESAKSQTEPVVNVVSVTVGSSTPLDPTTWVPVGLWPHEYDPAKPNDYAAIHKEKMRQQQREELERLRQQELEKQKQDEEAARNGTGGEGGDATTSPEPQAPLLPSYIDPNKKTFAARMMEKMGWKQGEGLGANKQGITAPLVARKTAMRSGIIVQGHDVTSLGQVPRVVTFNMAPTRILLLLNMVGRGQVDADLKEETEEEAAKLGNLLQVRIFEAAGVPDDCAVRIFCEYERKEEATRALLTFNGRAFGGRTVKAKFYSEERFAKDDLRPDPEQEVDQHVTVTI